LKDRRLSLGLTQEELADRSGLAVRHYQKLEAGQVNVTLKSLVALSTALRLEMSSLFS
jgi:transcriptional regulator with XRE-family HTH domain